MAIHPEEFKDKIFISETDFKSVSLFYVRSTLNMEIVDGRLFYPVVII